MTDLRENPPNAVENVKNLLQTWRLGLIVMSRLAKPERVSYLDGWLKKLSVLRTFPKIGKVIWIYVKSSAEPFFF